MRWLRRLFGQDPYPPEAAEAPYVDGMALSPACDPYTAEQEAYDWANLMPTENGWTVRQRAELAALDGEQGADWAVETVLLARIAMAADGYRRGLDLGGARELSAVSHWTTDGWVLDRRVP